MSSQAISSPATVSNMASDLKPMTTTSSSTGPKPCCVCKDEKAARDECMLFSNATNPQEECESMVQKYRSCMAGYGFKLN